MNAILTGTTLTTALAALPLAFGELPFIGAVPNIPANLQKTAPHVAMARELLDILSRTELLLQSCADADSVRAALPSLREQRRRMHEAAEKQRALPDPDEDDIRAVGELADTFSSLVESIREHAHRLHETGLMSSELETLLQMPREASDPDGRPAVDRP